MHPLLQAWAVDAPWLDALKLLIDVSLKGAVICAFAGIATLLLRRSSAFTRNMVWVFALAGLITLPAFSLMTPVWNLPLVPDLGVWAPAPYSLAEKSFETEAMVGPPRSLSAGVENPSLKTGAAGPLQLSTVAWFLLVWLGGVFLYLCSLLISRAGVRNIVRNASPAGSSWNALKDRLSAELGLGRRVSLLESNRLKAAITVGVVSPKVILPETTEDWPENRRALVLAHELAHIKRWDTLIETLAVAATVVYWFNPLVWYAVNQLRVERERDCDDVVLRTGVKPSDYAELLMNIAADLGGSAGPAWRLATISQGSNLKERLLCILNPAINRKRGSRGAAILIGAVVLAMVLPLSASGIWNSDAGDKSKQAQKETKEKLEPGVDYEKTHQKDAEAQKLKQEKMKLSVGERWNKVLENKNSAAVAVHDVIEKKGIAAGIDVYKKLQTKGGYYFDESEFNLLGYVFLSAKRPEEAIGIFKLNVESYPQSWNVHDSLGEAYLTVDQLDKALECYKTSVDLNPKNKNGEEKIKIIKTKMKTQA